MLLLLIIKENRIFDVGFLIDFQATIFYFHDSILNFDFPLIFYFYYYLILLQTHYLNFLFYELLYVLLKEEIRSYHLISLHQIVIFLIIFKNLPSP